MVKDIAGYMAQKPLNLSRFQPPHFRAPFAKTFFIHVLGPHLNFTCGVLDGPHIHIYIYIYEYVHVFFVCCCCCLFIDLFASLLICVYINVNVPIYIYPTQKCTFTPIRGRFCQPPGLRSRKKTTNTYTSHISICPC